MIIIISQDGKRVFESDFVYMKNKRVIMAHRKNAVEEIDINVGKFKEESTAEKVMNELLKQTANRVTTIVDGMGNILNMVPTTPMFRVPKE